MRRRGDDRCGWRNGGWKCRRPVDSRARAPASALGQLSSAILPASQVYHSLCVFVCVCESESFRVLEERGKVVLKI